ncbi:MAG: hypothetical protein OSJ61_00150 [Lachnospiraceae bacterium]|nr:hypothetical protein [Lachnospiraceae bacterium]
MNMYLLVDEMSKALDILGEGLQNVAKTLRKLIECFCEEREEEKTTVSSPKQYGILLKNISRNRTKSCYRQPYIQVPKHLAYQKRYYQS